MPTLTWTNSTPGPRQRTLAHTDIGMRVVGAPSFDKVGSVPVPGAAFTIDPTLAPGDYEFNATEVDVAGAASANNPTCKFSFAFDAPSGVSNLAAA